MSSTYVSSIVSKYGDIDKVSLDSARVFEILDRQGTSLLIDLIAEYQGRAANKFKLRPSERVLTILRLSDEFKNALQERL
jgi:hypothetical protein